MSVPKLAFAESLLALRWPGLVGALLLLGSAGYGLGMLRPMHEETLTMQARAQKAERLAEDVRKGKASAPQTAAGRRDQFYATLAPQEQVTQYVDRIYAAATAEGLMLMHGEYAGADLPKAGLARYRIVLPVKGSYGQLRRFITAATTAMPGLLLDDLNLQRQNVADPQIEARVHLSLFLVKR
jgi:pimeloyl-ACP methyl ester carboxylesterase